MNFFRSQTMGYYKLIIPRESAWNVMNELAELDCIHFVDYDPSLPLINRPFANYIKRCDDLLVKVSNIEHEMQKYNKKITFCKDVNLLIRNFKTLIKERSKASHTYLEEVEQEIEKKNGQLIEQGAYMENLQERRNKLIESKAVLLKGESLLGQQFFQPQNYQAEGYLDIAGKDFDDIRLLQGQVKFNYLVGVINKEEQIRFKRIIFRVTKGNVWINTMDIETDQIIDTKNQESMIKSVFVIVYPGGGGSNLIQNKLNKICESFQVSKHTFPENTAMYQEKLRSIEADLVETKNLIVMTKNQIDAYLEEFARIPNNSNCSNVEELKLFIIKEKYLYTQLNYMRIQGSVFYGSIWLPQGADQKVDQALRDVQQAFESLPAGQLQIAPPEGSKPPPTFFDTNVFTWGFQEIVNTYGLPRYKEINPGLFTCMTFPFLFGVMFADIGHGFCLLMAGFYMILYNTKLKDSDSVFRYALQVRHMLVLMGFWAFYNGWIYNDFISISFNMFDSCYRLEKTDNNKEEWVRREGCTYPFGVDPVWSVAENQLAFINSYKMKLSVIIGVIHMTFGILMKGLNCIHFSIWLDFIFEFVPQLIFFICTFGYMDYLIIYKWLHVYNPSKAPSIITLMINMILQPTAPVDPPLWGDGVGEQQTSLTLLLLALICCPIMLFVKPCWLNHKNKQYQLEHQQRLDQNDISTDSELYQKINEVKEETEEEGAQQYEEEHGHNEDFGDLFVHQVIETIEFVLGSISNTASYLRLWALSLAHGQLAEVFFGMCLAGSIDKGGFGGFIGLMFGYGIFSLATFGVLMMMDVMECFLHALRLHWVEFQNKFFKADGYPFEKCSFSIVLKENAEPLPE